MMLALFRFWFRLKGWKTSGGTPPGVRKCVMVAAPHTSNWDFVYAMAALSIMGVRTRFLAKKSLFRFPLGLIMYPWGGIPVDRSKNNSMVEAMINQFKIMDDLILLVPAEGTRGKVMEWKSGFYYTAVGAGVPIALGYLDYGKKEAGIMTEPFYPSGDYQKDLPLIKARFKGKTARHPEMASV